MMATDDVYDICVVGAGLWGSAAAYHASSNTETKVCLIGPDEPKSKECTGRTVFGAYYDEARITRQNVSNDIDAELARRSHEGFLTLERETGASFYKECHNFSFGRIGSEYVLNSKRTAERLGLEHRLLSSNDVKRLFPYMTISTRNEGVLQLAKCGMVNPRQLVFAQKQAARNHGCLIITSIVDRIIEKYDHLNKDTILDVITEDDHIIKSRKVLLCTGGFTLSKQLLPLHLLPDLRLAPTQTLRVELTAEDAHTLQDMPTMAGMAREEKFSDCYMCPPVTYPDGKTYLKIGHGRLRYLEANEEVAEWYYGDGDPKVTKRLEKMVQAYIPDIHSLSYQVDTCVVTATQGGLPYIDMVTPQIGIAIGGNGVGARWSYEVAKIAAKMITKGQWDYDLPHEYFKAQFKNENTPSRL